MARTACAACHQRDRAPKLTRCIECWLKVQPITVRQKYAQSRKSMLPIDLRLSRVPPEHWPPGRRWCAGCQSFVLLADCSGSRCKTCLSISVHASAVERTYGITREEYEKLLTFQGGVCYICGRQARSKRLAVDHDHVTGRVRGLLCADSDRGCNAAILGNIRDLAMARRIVEYLEHPPAFAALVS